MGARQPARPAAPLRVEFLGDGHLRAGRRSERARLVLLQLLRLLAHLLAEIGTQLVARLGGEREPDARAHEAAEGKDADAAERGRPCAAAFLEADRLEDIVAVDVLQILEGLQAAPPDVLDVHGASTFAALARREQMPSCPEPQSAHCAVATRARPTGVRATGPRQPSRRAAT